MGQVLMSKTDYAAGRPHLEEALALARDSAVPSGARAARWRRTACMHWAFLPVTKGMQSSRVSMESALRAYREIAIGAAKSGYSTALAPTVAIEVITSATVHTMSRPSACAAR